MFNLNSYKKKFRKLLLPINKIIDSFFDELTRSKYSKNKKGGIKKNFIRLDQKIESFFNKFKEIKKYNQSKKIFNVFEYKKSLILVIIFLFFSTYFILPSFYNKDEIENLLKNQMLNKYELDLSFNEKIGYSLLPKPFFYTKNLDIIHKEKILSNSDYVKFYISFSNLFSLKKIKVQDIVFKNTEFEINAGNINFFKKTLNNPEKLNKVFFKKSKFFYRDKESELLFLSKIDNLKFFYDEKNKLQKVKSFFEIFNIPFRLNISKDINSENKNLKLTSKKIRLNIETSIEHNNSEISGSFLIEIINKNNSFNYTIKNNTLNFFSNDKNFDGKLNFKPFYFSSNLNFDYINQRKIFQKESLLLDLFNSELLNNPNLSASVNIFIKKIDKFEYLEDYSLKLEFDDGRIFINNFDAKWNKSVSINSNDIEFINNEDGKRLIGEIIFNFDDIEKFFRYFQIKRNYRNVFDKIKADINYDFVSDKLIINNLKIDEKSYKILDELIESTNKEEMNLFNKVIFRNFVKKFFQAYAG
tara:strand:- start:432 stop:2015 length:1584 start_codon:yes stop_codon:yes gene_type:complete